MRLLLLALVLVIVCVPVLGQDTPPIPEDVDTSAITDDQVNAIANQLYCPVCENIPLDTCGTAACDDWREEIRGMLAVGMPEAEIVDNFVVRFGDRVVSSPRHPIIAALSVAMPWVFLVLAAGIAIYSIFHMLQSGSQSSGSSAGDNPDEPTTRDRYLEQLEKDLAGK